MFQDAQRKDLKESYISRSYSLESRRVGIDLLWYRNEGSALPCIRCRRDEEKRYDSSLVCLLPLQENVPQTLDEGNALAQSSEQVHYPCLGSGG